MSKGEKSKNCDVGRLLAKYVEDNEDNIFLQNDRKRLRYWEKPKNIDDEFDRLAKRLRRVPTHTEFVKGCPGAIGAIKKGRYLPRIRTYNQYLTKRGIEPNYLQNKWNKKLIDEIVDSHIAKEGKPPTYVELQKHGGALAFIQRGAYSQSITTYRQYLISRELKPARKENISSNEEVDFNFDRLRKKLKRMPTQEEFGSNSRGSLKFITKGKYGKDVNNYNSYLTLRGFPVRHHIKWNKKTLLEEIKRAKIKLNRTPHQHEISPGALGAIYRGRYDPKITTWNDFLKCIGEKIEKKNEKGRWKNIGYTLQFATEIIKDQKWEDLPGSKILFRNGYSNLIYAIGRYHGGFLAFREKLNEYLGRTSEQQQLEGLLETYIGEAENE